MSDEKKIITRFDAIDTEPQCTAIKHGNLVCYSDKSPTKKTPNEDALAIIPVDDVTTVLIVADGLGGMPSGEQASQIVVECIIDSLNDGIQTRDAILNGIDDANNIILELKTGAGTTISITEINGNTLRTYHAGDSLILLATNNSKVKYQSISHSPIGYALECGAINKEKAMRHTERNLISNYVGCNDMYINIGPIVELTPTDTLLLSSDALSNNLTCMKMRSVK